MMRFYVDESGDFRIPDNKGAHAVGIAVGIVIPEDAEVTAFQRLDDFKGQLPHSAFENGEPKGSLLNADGRKQFCQLMHDLDDVLVCPIMLDLSVLAGRNDDNIRANIVQEICRWADLCRHQSMREQVELLARQFGKLNIVQILRLATWARCIMRCTQDSATGVGNSLERQDAANTLQRDPHARSSLC